ncbi:tRNA synthetases class II-domain-containing protein [Xylogone sp. PMI_703]|nr:tRNA synthetases class II-domain-containing protein [Xylogone sp. PMI_703]
MLLTTCYRGHALRNVAKYRLGRPERVFSRALLTSLQTPYQRLHSTSSRYDTGSKEVIETDFWKEFKESLKAPTPTLTISKWVPSNSLGERVTAVGFIGRRRDVSSQLSFVNLGGGDGPETIQVISRRGVSEDRDLAANILKSIKPNSAVSVTGILQKKELTDEQKRNQNEDGLERTSIAHVEIDLEIVQCLNSFKTELTAKEGTQFGGEDRHLQIRFDPSLKRRLQFRSKLTGLIRQELSDFQEIETPILFKSTPEGAREFLVPTRKKGYAYALPQSPQQYKQILMASGIRRYMQFAKCFRDEDLRADRQPEFTQVDLEMSWTDGEGVMQRMESFLKSLFKRLNAGGELLVPPLPDTPFLRMTYDEAISKHGIDKPDLRIHDLIYRIDHLLPSDLTRMLTSLQSPMVEACRFRFNADPKTIQKFIRKFMDSPDAEPFNQNPDGPPGVFVVDSRRPLEGLQAFGFEGASKLKEFYEALPVNSQLNVDNNEESNAFEDGDLLLVQARPNTAHNGGSTALGRLRLLIHKEAIRAGLIELDPGFHFLWVTHFPMFTPDNATDPGQGGSAGFSATHHPFTAPKTPEDAEMLLVDPLKAIADHYDIVVNGVELGGGSRRIHNAEMQMFVMRNIIGMSDERMQDFSHLFEALKAGCPPHAGIALGFDRLVALLQNCESVRDVIAFPKSAKGDDLMVRSPNLITEEQLETYHLKIID